MDHHPTTVDEDVYATFTQVKKRCERPSCSGLFPAQELKLVKAKFGADADRLYCPSCYEYVLSKGSTMRKTDTARNVQNMFVTTATSTSTHPPRDNLLAPSPFSLNAPLVRSSQETRIPHSGASSMSLAHINQVRQDVNVAQRRAGNVPVSAIGFPVSKGQISVPTKVPQPYASSSHSTPTIALPGSANYVPATGYTPQHQFFIQELKKGQKKAMSLQQASHTVSVRCNIKVLHPAKSGPVYKQVGEYCAVTIDDISVHVGAQWLKDRFCDEFDREDVEYSFYAYCQLKLNQNCVRLEHADSNAAILPNADPDVNAIYKHFYTATGKFRRTFVLKIYLVLHGSYYEQVNEHVQMLKEAEDEMDDSAMVQFSKNLRVTPSSGSRDPSVFSDQHRQHFPSAGVNLHVLGDGAVKEEVLDEYEPQQVLKGSGNLIDLTHTSTPSPHGIHPSSSVLAKHNRNTRKGKGKASPVQSPLSSPERLGAPSRKSSKFVAPDVDKLREALSSQVPLSRKALRETVASTSFTNVQVYLSQTFNSWDDLNASSSGDLKTRHFVFCDLSVDFSESALIGEGSFKRAHPGNLRLNPSYPSSEQLIKQLPPIGPSVCVKQVCTRDKDKKLIFFNGPSTLKKLLQELVVHEWANTLFQFTYNFVDEHHQKYGVPSESLFKIPRLRYVRCALAHLSASDDNKCFLVEEMISKDSEGPFIKYINNASGEILDEVPKDRLEIAQFLSFAQHQQYEATGGLAFVTDFQGGSTLLSDPQILTNPDEINSDTFGEGNAFEPIF